MLTEETALLLLENADGQRYLAAGTLEGGDARFSLSSPLPEDMHARFEPALPCTAFLYFEHPDRLGQQVQELSVLFHPETDVVLAVLDGRRDSYLSVPGVWESGWAHVYDRRIPGIEGFVRQEDLTPHG